MRVYVAAVLAAAFTFLLGAYLRERAYRDRDKDMVDVTWSGDGSTYTFRGGVVTVVNDEDIHPYDPYTVGYTH